MARMIVLLSGSVASGKSTLGNQLVSDFGATLIKTWKLLTEKEPSISRDRGSLQSFGEKLDVETEGRWVSEALGKRVSALDDDAIIVVDSVRILAQIDCVRQGFGTESGPCSLGSNGGRSNQTLCRQKAKEY